MLSLFNNRSIRSKLTLMTMMTVLIALVLACAGFVGLDYWNFRQDFVRQLSTHADIIAGNSTAALSFDNATDATQTLASLTAEKDIQAACIYSSNGDLFATYPRP